MKVFLSKMLNAKFNLAGLLTLYMCELQVLILV